MCPFCRLCAANGSVIWVNWTGCSGGSVWGETWLRNRGFSFQAPLWARAQGVVCFGALAPSEHYRGALEQGTKELSTANFWFYFWLFLLSLSDSRKILFSARSQRLHTRMTDWTPGPLAGPESQGRWSSTRERWRSRQPFINRLQNIFKSAVGWEWHFSMKLSKSSRLIISLYVFFLISSS